MTNFSQPHNAPLRRLISAVLAAYWLLAAITLCAPMVMAEQANAEPASNHSGMSHHMDHAASTMDDTPAAMDCCADNEPHTAVTCDTGVADDGSINHTHIDLGDPTLVLLASYLAAPVLSQPPTYPRHTPEHHSTYPRLHLQLSVLLD
jgi:hypothetical protein